MCVCGSSPNYRDCDVVLCNLSAMVGLNWGEIKLIPPHFNTIFYGTEIGLIIFIHSCIGEIKRYLVLVRVISAPGFVWCGENALIMQGSTLNQPRAESEISATTSSLVRLCYMSDMRVKMYQRSIVMMENYSCCH